MKNSGVPHSQRDPIRSVEALAQRETDATLDVLLHLNEIETRRLHSRHGYGSMFDFATRHLRYSESAAGRRIQVARCLRRFPELADLFRAREVNLSTVCHLGRVLDDENDRELIARVRGKSQREVEKIVAEYGAPAKIREAVTPIRRPGVGNGSGERGSSAGPGLFEPGPDVAAAPANGFTNGGRPDALGRWSTRAGDRERNDADGGVRGRAPKGEERPPETQDACFQVRFVVGPELKRKLDRARVLLSGRFPRGASLEELFDAALESLLDRECPIRRKERRDARRTKRNRSVDPIARVVAAEADRPAGQAAPAASAGRRIPQAVRDEVFARDDGRCTFVGASGRTCHAKHGLQIDHVVPFALGGASTPDNLRLLCAKHNRLEAERFFGERRVREAIAARQRRNRGAVTQSQEP